MVLCPEDERRIKGTMLAGWMSEADLFRGWASQGKKKNQPASEAGEKKSGEEVSFKHLKVKIKGREMRISALFNRGAPDTLIGYNHSGDFPQVILIIPSHVPNKFILLIYVIDFVQLCSPIG
jgi:hypothetical protein